ncbi:MAG: EutN/CcmL family microcompartment protein, partial [Ruminiclostridium sp.]
VAMRLMEVKMFVAKVIGVVISTCKVESLKGQKLLIVRDVHEKNTKNSLIAVDSLGAGVGELVLVVHDGGAARQAIQSKDAPINAAVVGIIDYPEDYN